MELAYDTLFIMRHIWKIIDRDSHDAAAIFAACITDAVNGRDGFNLWCAPECEVEIGVRSTWDEEAAPS
ncbi:MAG: hypothetical protein IJI97_08300 [Clostridia bacterium]|nr:hypothetical protein [Clostridia bacterium]